MHISPYEILGLLSYKQHKFRATIFSINPWFNWRKRL